MSDDLADRFHNAMIESYTTIGRESGYWATRYLMKIRKDGGVAAAKYWLKPRDGVSKGFAALAAKGRLDVSMEAMVLSEPWRQLFTDEELRVAQQRLDDNQPIAQ